MKSDRKLADSLGFKIAGKFVRGAYMIEERRLASQLGYEDPINENYEKTGEMYRACADYVLPGIKNNELKFMFATHNEETVQYIAERYVSYVMDVFLTSFVCSKSLSDVSSIRLLKVTKERLRIIVKLKISFLYFKSTTYVLFFFFFF